MSSLDGEYRVPSHPKYTATESLAVLFHGGMHSVNGKTGLALARFAPERVKVMIDSESAGQSLKALTGIPLEHDIPIVATAQEALRHQPEVLAIGIAPSGGKLPVAWQNDLVAAVKGGMSILNGLHTRLEGHPELTPHLGDKQFIWDIRVEPANLPIGSGAARLLNCQRVLFVGTDMAVGKMSAAIALHRAAKNRGLRSKFIATGQTGIMLEGDGIPLDGIRIDFASGSVQQEVVASAQTHEIVFVEGQGSLLNPASTATLPLLRGTQPTHLILVHKAAFTHLKDFPWITVPPLKEVVTMYETVVRAAGAFYPAKVAGIALNSTGLTDAEAAYECARITAETGLPCQDVVRFGGQGLLSAIR